MKRGGRRVPLSSGQVGHHRLLQGTRGRNLSSLPCPRHPEPPLPPQVMRPARSLSPPAATARSEDLPHPMDHTGSGNSKMYILFGAPTLGLMPCQMSGGDAQEHLPSPASMMRPTMRPWGSASSRGARGGTGPPGQTQQGRSHTEPRPVTLPGGWVRTAKSRSTLLFFPLGFLCVREPR